MGVIVKNSISGFPKLAGPPHSGAAENPYAQGLIPFLLIAALAVLIASLQFAHAAPPSRMDDHDEIRFGIIPGLTEHTYQGWQEFVRRLGKDVGVNARSFQFANLHEAVQAFAKGDVDLAFVGNATALEIVEQGSGEVFAQLITEDGPGYHSLLVAPKASKINTLEDVLHSGGALRFSDGAVSSTSGRLVPLYYAFFKNGIQDPATFFKQYEAGSHQQNLLKAAENKIDVATTNDSELRIFIKSRPELARNIKTVWSSPEIPQSPLLWKHGLSSDIKRKIQSFVTATSLGGAEKTSLQAVLEQMDVKGGFRKSSNRQLLRVADVEMFAAKLRIENDKSLNQEQRDAAAKQLFGRAAKTEMKLMFKP